MEEDIKILKEFIEIDRRMRNPEEDFSDYDEFCERRCIAIENVLKELDEIKKKFSEYIKVKQGVGYIEYAMPKKLAKVSLEILANNQFKIECEKKDKMLDLMLQDLMACGGLDFIDIGISNGSFSADKEKLKYYYERKVKNEL